MIHEKASLTIHKKKWLTKKIVKVSPFLYPLLSRKKQKLTERKISYPYAFAIEQFDLKPRVEWEIEPKSYEFGLRALKS